MSLSKNINPSLILVQPRKTRPFITERLKNQIKQKKMCSLSDKKKFNFDLTLSLLVVLITFANNLDPDQDRRNVGPDMDPNCLTP